MCVKIMHMIMFVKIMHISFKIMHIMCAKLYVP